mgnify:CR=1 FL=1
MNFSMAQRILGLMLMIFSLTMLPPIAVSFLYDDGHWQPFFASAAVIASAGVLLWLPARNTRRELRLRDGFLIVEEGQPEFIEQAVNTILRRADVETRIEGKSMLPMAGEYTGGVMKEGIQPSPSRAVRFCAASLLPPIQMGGGLCQGLGSTLIRSSL